MGSAEARASRPRAVTAVVALIVSCLVLAGASGALHLWFDARLRQLFEAFRGSIKISVGGPASLLWLAEPAKVLVLVAGLALWYGLRRRERRAWVAGLVLMTASVLAAAAAALYDGLRLTVVFVGATVSTALDGTGRHEPYGLTLGVGLAAVIADVLLVAVAAQCVALLTGPLRREYLR